MTEPDDTPAGESDEDEPTAFGKELGELAYDEMIKKVTAEMTTKAAAILRQALEPQRVDIALAISSIEGVEERLKAMIKEEYSKAFDTLSDICEQAGAELETKLFKPGFKVLEHLALNDPERHRSIMLESAHTNALIVEGNAFLKKLQQETVKAVGVIHLEAHDIRMGSEAARRWHFVGILMNLSLFALLLYGGGHMVGVLNGMLDRIEVLKQPPTESSPVTKQDQTPEPVQATPEPPATEPTISDDSDDRRPYYEEVIVEQDSPKTQVLVKEPPPLPPELFVVGDPTCEERSFRGKKIWLITLAIHCSEENFDFTAKTVVKQLKRHKGQGWSGNDPPPFMINPVVRVEEDSQKLVFEADTYTDEAASYRYSLKLVKAQEPRPRLTDNWLPVEDVTDKK